MRCLWMWRRAGETGINEFSSCLPERVGVCGLQTREGGGGGLSDELATLTAVLHSAHFPPPHLPPGRPPSASLPQKLLHCPSNSCRS